MIYQIISFQFLYNQSINCFTKVFKTFFVIVTVTKYNLLSCQPILRKTFLQEKRIMFNKIIKIDNCIFDFVK